MVWRQRERSIEIGDGLVRLPQRLQRAAAIDEDLGTGPQRDGPVVARDRIRDASEFLQGDAPVVPGIRAPRIDRDHPVETRDRVREALQARQRIAARVIGVGEIRLQGDGVVAVGQGLVRSLQRHQHGGQIGMSFGRSRVDQQGPPERLCRSLGVAALVFGQAEQLQRIEMVRAFFQDPPVGGLRIGKQA
jgi:hypothetical protein